MADSVGGPVFPRTSIQEGHLHFDKTTNTLFVYNGGDPSDTNNWSVVSPISSSGGSSVQRYHFRLTGLDNAQTLTEFYFFAPFAGTITEWALFVASQAIPAGGADMQLVIDPFGSFTIVDSFTIPENTGGLAGTTVRAVSGAVADGAVILVVNNTIFAPAANGVVISGYVDVTPA
jgi:hypothetical protein